MIRIGLTGSIATGKSTTANLFAEEGVAVYDADAAVHAIYKEEGVKPVGALVPEAIVDGQVDRTVLKAALTDDPDLLSPLESIVHPLVQAREAAAAAKARQDGHTIMVFDIPLLFETGGETRMDKIVVVHCSPETQLARLLDRPGVDGTAARLLMDRQMPQPEKMRRADYLISTDEGVAAARHDVRRILADLRA